MGARKSELATTPDADLDRLTLPRSVGNALRMARGHLAQGDGELDDVATMQMQCAWASHYNAVAICASLDTLARALKA